MYLDKRKFYDRVKELDDPYWKSAKKRWSYMSLVVEQLKKWEPETVLELGAYKLPLTDFSDTMDCRNLPETPGYPTILHDATKIPWPIEDKKYDVFIALQVWEHLEGKQSLAFKEVMRIADKAILSFPYKWRNRKPEYADHADIDEKVIKKWSLGIEPVDIKIRRKKIICCWDFTK